MDTFLIILLSWILCSYVEFCELVCFLLGFSQSEFFVSPGVFPSVFPLVDVGHHPPKSTDVPPAPI